MSNNLQLGARICPTVDLSPFTEKNGAGPADSQRQKAGLALVEACHGFGFVKIVGHGVTKQEIDEALGWTRRLFDLPSEEKMKAPHPAGPIPHRGYSGLGTEKVYSMAEVESHAAIGNDVEAELRKISDFKESYEIGSEYDDQQQNIWLPDEVLPGFQTYMSSLYERLAGVGKVVLEAMGVGLDLDSKDQATLMQLDSVRHSQLRLLHYPPLSKTKLERELLARLPAHNDWSAFTMLFQDERGGLELRDPKSQEFLPAEPEEGALVLNIGDMLQRFTNDYFISALHRVSVPSPETVPESGIPARYSIPFFVGPEPSHTIASLPKFIGADTPAKYEPVKFEDYAGVISKYQYQEQQKTETKS